MKSHGINRQQFIKSTAALLGGPLLLGACSARAGEQSYEVVAGRTWRRPQDLPSGSSLLQRELVRCATLAPSSHNTQCWRYHIGERAITILPDLSRRCPAVDPDDHHLYVSLGCAAENLIQAALANGLKGSLRRDAAVAGGVVIDLEPTRASSSPLYQAIADRQCTRAEFDGKPLSAEELGMLERAGTGNGVRILLFTDRAMMEKVLECVVAGNTAQMHDPAFVAELKAWIRFGRDEAVQSGDGLFSGVSGNPSVPRWLGSLLFGAIFRVKNENEKYARHVRSSAGIAVLVSETSDKAHWVEAGRCYQRFALQSAALGIRNALINQPIEVSALRPQFASLVGAGDRRPDMVVRFGRGPRMPQSLRRPLEAVLA